MIRKKKTGYCDYCSFYIGNNTCGAGLGKSPVPEERICLFILPLRPKRCGTCVHFSLSSDVVSLNGCSGGGVCSYHKDFRNFFSSCDTPGAYKMENGKDLR